MKKYLVFAGYNYYPFGGWSDFQNSFEDFEEAKQFFKDKAENFNWGHIVESESVVWHFFPNEEVE